MFKMLHLSRFLIFLLFYFLQVTRQREWEIQNSWKMKHFFKHMDLESNIFKACINKAKIILVSETRGRMFGENVKYFWKEVKSFMLEIAPYSCLQQFEKLNACQKLIKSNFALNVSVSYIPFFTTMLILGVNWNIWPP